MRKHLLLSIVLIYTALCYGDGWRVGEKQIIVYIDSHEQAAYITDLKLNFDILSADKIRAYLIPEELELLRAKGIIYEVEIDDLAKHYMTFWSAKDAYHSYQQIIDLADSLEQAFPDICKKYIFGTSLGGRQCAALKISDNVETDEPEAEVMFDGGIHGDEIGGSENVIRFARDLCIDYGTDSIVTNLIDDREIWLYLMVNPDGRVNMSRYNNNGVDLNRDWAYMWDGEGGSTGPCSQVESKALRECMYNNQFVVHTSYHSGTEYISCPWSYRPGQPLDWNHIYQLAGVYSSVSGYPNLDYGQGYGGMYPINGSTKDSNYGIMGSVTWSMEISYEKQPPPSQIMIYYNRNYPSMMAMIEYAGYGLQGAVTDAITGEPVAAIIFVNDYYPTYTDPEIGDYHKYVLPGTYSISVVANGYEKATKDGIVVTEYNATTTDFELQPSEGHSIYRFAASQIPNNNHADEGYTPAVLGIPDNINYSIGKNGWCILDMQYPFTNNPGYDIIVYEGDNTPEIYTCFIGQTVDGPWYSLGAGSGTSEFDMASTGLDEAQFVRILDDGNGIANEPDAGFDMDAIEVIESAIFLTIPEYSIVDESGNNNGKIDPGETVDLVITVKNNGYSEAENIEGIISTSSVYLNIISDTASFGNLSQGQTGDGVFTLMANANTPQGEPAEIELAISSNGGSYSKTFFIDFVIGQIPIAIIDLDLNHNSASSIKTALQNNSIAVENLTSFPGTVDIYTTLFVCLGIYSNNHVLAPAEGQILADFLNNGGNLYMEGGDTWFFDDQTAVHSMFNINGLSDGSSDLNTINGQPGTFTEGMSFSYGVDNNYIDHISPISPAFLILENQSPSYGTAIANDAVSYKTIGASHEFGGLTDGISPSTKTELMAAYLEFFGIDIPLQAVFTSSNTEICEQGTVDFTDMSAGNVLTWEWAFEGGSPATSSFPNPTVTYFYEGSFDVTLTVSNGDDSSTVIMEDYINIFPIPEIPVMPNGEILVLTEPGMTNDYSVDSVAGADTYIWQLSPEEAGVLLPNNSICTIDWTDYWVGEAYLSVKAANECGESLFSDPLIINVLYDNVATYNPTHLYIFPNPSAGKIQIHLHNSSSEKLDLFVLDNLGKSVYSESGIQIDGLSEHSIDLSGYREGLYFVKIRSDKTSFMKKIIIRK